MATLEELHTALRNADAAGDIPAATALAQHIKSLGTVTAKPQTYDPTEGMSGVDKFMAGAGKAVSDIGSGLQQLSAHALDAINPLPKNLSGLVTGQQPSRGAAIDAEVNDAKARDAALMNTGAGLTGNIAGNVATFLLPAGGIAKGAEALNLARTAGAARAIVNPTTYKAAAAAGALQGAVQPVADGENRLLNAGLGGAAGIVGNGLINAVGRVAQPVANALTPAASKAVQMLTAAGVPLDAAQQSGSPLLNRLRSGMMDNPFTAKGAQESVAKQGAAFNNALLKTIGESGPAATSDVMGGAQTRINAVFKDVLDRNELDVTNPLLAKLGAVQAKANTDEKRTVAAYANQLLDAMGPNGKVPGQVAYAIKKDLDRLSSSPDTTLAYHARQLRSVVMDGIDESLPAADKAAFTEARGQFRNMRTIEGAIDPEGHGSISPAKLANIMGQKRNVQTSKYGKGDQEVADLAKAGKMLLQDKLPNSGTAARAYTQFLPSAAVGGVTLAGGGDATDAARLAAGTYALPKALQFMLSNPKTAAYLAQGISQGKLRNVLTAPQENALLSMLLRTAPAAAVPALTR